jgi:hypothetical protein
MENFCLKDEIIRQNNLIFEKIKPSNKETVKMMITKYDVSHPFLRLISDNIKNPYSVLYEKIKEALDIREKTLISMTTYL